MEWRTSGQIATIDEIKLNEEEEEIISFWRIKSCFVVIMIK